MVIIDSSCSDYEEAICQNLTSHIYKYSSPKQIVNVFKQKNIYSFILIEPNLVLWKGQCL